MINALTNPRLRPVTSMIAAGMTAALLGMGMGMGVGQGPADDARRAMQKMKHQIGAFDFDARMDLGALGQPGVTVNIKGTSKSQAVLSETGVLSVSEADGKKGSGGKSSSYYGGKGLENSVKNLSYMMEYQAWETWEKTKKEKEAAEEEKKRKMKEEEAAERKKEREAF